MKIIPAALICLLPTVVLAADAEPKTHVFREGDQIVTLAEGHAVALHVNLDKTPELRRETFTA